jgi:hypothetical protein
MQESGYMYHMKGSALAKFFVYEEYCRLGCNVVYLDRSLSTFRKTVLVPSSGQKMGQANSNLQLLGY